MSSRLTRLSLRNKMDVIYSKTQAGYRAWLEDGNEGTYEDFLQGQAKVSDKKHLIEKIEAELNEILEEVKDLLEAIYNKNFIS